MEIALILQRLWRRRLALAVGAIVAGFLGIAAVYEVSFAPLSIKRSSIQYGAATTRILVDTPSAALADARVDLSPLTTRAQVIAVLLGTEPVRATIARKMGVPISNLAVFGQDTVLGTRAATDVKPEERSAQLIAQHRAMVVRFLADKDLPMISVSAEAPDAATAVRLANAAASGVSTYFNQLGQRVPAQHEVELRQIGTADGGVVNSGSSRIVAMLISIVAFGAIALMILVVDHVRGSLRAVAMVPGTPKSADV